MVMQQQTAAAVGTEATATTSNSSSSSHREQLGAMSRLSGLVCLRGEFLLLVDSMWVWTSDVRSTIGRLHSFFGSC